MSLTGLSLEILKLSLMGTVLTVLLLLLKKILRKHLSARWQHAVWFLLVLRLLMPVAPQNALSMHNLLTPLLNGIQQQGNYLDVHEIQLNNDQYYDYTDNGTTKESTIGENKNAGLENITGWQGLNNNNIKPSNPAGNKTFFTITDFIALIWMLGAVLMMAVTIVSNVRFSRMVRYSVPCSDKESLNLLKRCYRIAAVNRNIPLIINENVKVPLLFGIIKPRLIISSDVLNKLSPQQKKHVFLHELIHYKRKDILINWFVAILRSIYWFNPVIVYAFHKMKEDCELACDEQVLKKLKPFEYAKYGQTIINLVEMLSVPNTLDCTSGLLQKKSSVKRRIYMISGFKRKTALTTLLALIITLLVGCSGLSNADKTVPPAASPDKESNNTIEYQTGNDSDNNSEHTNQPEESPSETADDTDPAGQNSADEQNPDNAKDLPDTATIEEKVQFYLDKLKDKSYTGTYGEGYTWYTAAEELGMIGKPAIPGLIEKLDSKDDYERALALYALLLASQHDNVKSFTNGEYINVNLDFNAETHPEMIEIARAWWEKYKENF
jgi:bla regulator protein BlaR1